jgi:hypothetical protein
MPKFPRKTGIPESGVKLGKCKPKPKDQNQPAPSTSSPEATVQPEAVGKEPILGSEMQKHDPRPTDPQPQHPGDIVFIKVPPNANLLPKFPRKTGIPESGVKLGKSKPKTRAQNQPTPSTSSPETTVSTKTVGKEPVLGSEMQKEDHVGHDLLSGIPKVGVKLRNSSRTACRDQNESISSSGSPDSTLMVQEQEGPRSLPEQHPQAIGIGHIIPSKPNAGNKI